MKHLDLDGLRSPRVQVQGVPLHRQGGAAAGAVAAASAVTAATAATAPSAATAATAPSAATAATAATAAPAPSAAVDLVRIEGFETQNHPVHHQGGAEAVHSTAVDLDCLVRSRHQYPPKAEGEAEVRLEDGGTSVEVPVHPVASWVLVLRLVLGQLLDLSTITLRRQCRAVPLQSVLHRC